MINYHLIQVFEEGTEADLGKKRIDIPESNRQLEELLKTSLPERNVVVMFYSMWCPDCTEFYGDGIGNLAASDGVKNLDIFGIIEEGKLTDIDIVLVNVGSREQWKLIIDSRENTQGADNPYRKDPYNVDSIPAVVLYKKNSKDPFMMWGPSSRELDGKARDELKILLEFNYNINTPSAAPDP